MNLRRSKSIGGSALSAFLLFVLHAFIGACGLSEPEGGSSANVSGGKPNILLMVLDDLGFNDLAINNDNASMHTPNLDQIARDGVRFTRHYASPVCSPARAALLTGLYPERLGFAPAGRGISPEYVTLPEALKREGYTTWHVGKWHTGDSLRAAWPDRQGFDHWFGFLHQWRLAGKMSEGEIVPVTPRYTNPYLQGDAEPGRHYPGHLEDILTRKAIETIDALRERDAPWFLNVWFYAPHNPVTPASEFARLYPDTDAGRYRALVHQLDHNVGLIMRHLEATGELKNTIVVVVSDNGGTNEALDNNAPFPGKKASLLEGGLRTPLLIRWPESGFSGRVVSDVISIQDIYPTLLEAIGGASPEGLDGVSHFESITGRAPAPLRDLYWELGDSAYATLSADGRWFLHQRGPMLGVSFPLELYDLNLAPEIYVETPADNAGQMAAMTGRYVDWYKDVHTVSTNLEQGDQGTMLTGTDFLRSPGFGGYTLGIGVPDSYEGTVIGQPGIWVVRKSGRRITAGFGDLQLSGDIDKTNDCHNVVVTGNFRRPDRWPDKKHFMELALYIDEVEVARQEVPGVLALDDASMATMLGDPVKPAAQPSRQHPIMPPVILNTQLDSASPWKLVDFSRAICTGGKGEYAVGQ